MTPKNLEDFINYMGWQTRLTSDQRYVKKKLEDVLKEHGKLIGVPYEKAYFNNASLELYLSQRSRTGLAVLWNLNQDHKLKKERAYVCLRTDENLYNGKYKVYYLGYNALEKKIKKLGLEDEFKQQYETVPL